MSKKVMTTTQTATKMDNTEKITLISSARYAARSNDYVNGELDKQLDEVKAEIREAADKVPKFKTDIGKQKAELERLNKLVKDKDLRKMNAELTAMEGDASCPKAKINALNKEIKTLNSATESIKATRKKLNEIYHDAEEEFEKQYQEMRNTEPKFTGDKANKAETDAFDKKLTTFTKNLEKKFPHHVKRDNLRKTHVSNPKTVGLVVGMIAEDFVRHLVEHLVSNAEIKRLKLPMVWESDWSAADPAGFFRNLPCVARVRQCYANYYAEVERVNKVNKERRQNAVRNGETLAEGALEPTPKKPQLTTSEFEQAQVTSLRNMMKDKVISPVLKKHVNDDGKRTTNISTHMVDMVTLMVVEFMFRFRDNLTNLTEFTKKKSVRNDALLFLVKLQYQLNGLPTNKGLPQRIEAALAPQ